MMESDGELLRRYVDERSEPAFTALVERHINLVYRAALRRVGGNRHSADDVSQRVFTALARKAPTLKQHSSLVGWLYTSTRFAAAEVVRAEQRRRHHENEAHAMNELNAAPRVSLGELERFLDEIMDRLPDRDREAIALHFFEGRTFAEVASALASTADATRMRVNRAVERMREELARRGVTSTAAALGTALTAQSTIAAPAGLSGTVAHQALLVAREFAVGTSMLSRIFTAAKSSPWITAGVATVLCVGTGIVISSLAVTGNQATSFPREPEPTADPAAIQSAVPSGLPLPPASLPRTTARSNGQVGASNGGAVTPFSQLSVQEQMLLARLWNEQRQLPRVAGVGWGLRIGQAAPNYPGVQSLLDRGWVNYAEPKHVLHLTPRGRAFCSSHSAEILASAATQGMEVTDQPVQAPQR